VNKVKQNLKHAQTDPDASLKQNLSISHQ